MQNRSAGGRLWTVVQYACVLYVSQLLLSVAQKKYRAALEAQQLKQKEGDKVDLALEDSFPASDPPAYGGSHMVGPIH
jgi:hypothetical protein